MEPAFLNSLIVEDIMGSRFVRLHEPFRYQSAVLGRVIEVPAGFICDYESVPLIQATSKRGGVIHDYLCRMDSDPVVTKQVAASVYLEAQSCRDRVLNEGQFKRLNRFLRRQVKTLVVRLAPGYFHRLPVMASIVEVSAVV